MAGQAPWSRSFVVDSPGDGAGIELRQIDLKDFELCSTIHYIGTQTGLEGKLDDDVIENIRQVSPKTLPVTDLASVPQPLRWLVSQYGAHTPAALIHDRLIGIKPKLKGLTDAYTDRYFRFMLEDLGVRWLRRWLIWAAVALRTRSKGGAVKLASVVIWGLASAVGIALAVVALLQGECQLLLLTLVAPVGFALLWGRQYGAGLVAAMAAPWVLPPTLIGAVGFGLYAAMEWLAGFVVEREKTPVEPLRYRAF